MLFFFLHSFAGIASAFPTTLAEDSNIVHQLHPPSARQNYTEGTIFIAAAAVMGTVIMALLLWNARAIITYVRRRVQPPGPEKKPAAPARPRSPGNDSLGFGSTLSATRLGNVLSQARDVIGSEKASNGDCSANHRLDHSTAGPSKPYLPHTPQDGGSDICLTTRIDS